MYKRILVPLDGSRLAEVALPYAEELAGRLGSEITLLTVLQPSGTPPEIQHDNLYQSYLQNITQTTRREAEKYIMTPGERAEINSVLLIGEPAEQIVDYASKQDFSLILMATHGRSGIRRWTLGSVADRVARATDRPIALIRAKGARADVREKSILRKALVPLDGSKEAETVLPYVEELVTRLKAQVITLRVLVTEDFTFYTTEQLEQFKSRRSQAKSYIEKVAARLRDKGIDAKAEFMEALGRLDASEVIIDRTDKLQADVVAMSTHGRSGIGRWALGSVADKVLREGNTPLLLVRAKKGKK